MSSTFDQVATIIAETCDIPRDTITPESHAIDDLGIDSLDFLDIAFAIDKAFGDLAGLKEAFVKEGVGHFASGRVWLVAEGGALKVISTHDADDTLTKDGITPLLVCDLWEHAYYIDKRNDRKAFLEAWFDALPNWDLAASQLAAAGGEGEAWAYPPPA